MNRKVFILGPPRSGTTLLSAILANAGGRFALDPVDHWNPKAGELEHPLAIQASVQIDRSEKWKPISHSLSRHFENKAQDCLARLLKVADFVKYPPRSEKFPVLGVRLGYDPSCVVIVRPFLEFALSFLRMKNLDWLELESLYRQNLFTSVLLARQFGGCVIRYHDLVNLDTGRWLAPLSEATGLEKHLLEVAARKLVTPRKMEAPKVAIDRELDELLASIGHPATER